MRVVAGVARGRKLTAPAGRDVRPTSDRVREAMFNALESLELVRDLTVVDLFAGTGALGVEALSRGASAATFVDFRRKAVESVRSNLGATGLAERATVVQDRAEAWARRAAAGGEWYDLALCDPPYDYDGWEELLAALPVRFAVLESDRKLRPEGWHVVRGQEHGGTFVMITQRQSDPVPGPVARSEHS